MHAPQRSLLLALYTIAASAIVIVTLALRRKVDKKVGVFLILLYSIAYLLLYF